jgi:ribonucleoside-diphosphate reductase alpha chain
MASELGAFAGYEKNREHMLRVIRNHRQAAYGKKDGYEHLSVAPVPLDRQTCPDYRLPVHACSAWDKALEGRSQGECALPRRIEVVAAAAVAVGRRRCR